MKKQSKSKKILRFRGTLDYVLKRLRQLQDVFILKIDILINENETMSNVAEALEKIQTKLPKDVNLEWDVSFNKSLKKLHFEVSIPMKKQVSLIQ